MFFLRFFLASIILLWQIGFVETKESSGKNTADSSSDSSCVTCHTDYDALQSLASPDTEKPMEGCGGAAPYIAPHDRVFLGGPGYEAFKNSTHGMLQCSDCHGGVEDTMDKNSVHSGDFIKNLRRCVSTGYGGAVLRLQPLVLRRQLLCNQLLARRAV
jgi:hypothetical protein